MDRMASKPITADELLLMPGDRRCELVRGEVVDVSPAGYQHSLIAGRLARLVGSHVEERRLGVYLAPEAGFWIERNPDTVRAPDGAFLREERAREFVSHRGFVDGAPDLAFEVLSPTDRRKNAIAKCRQWIAAGAALSVLLDPDRRTATVFTAVGETELAGDATLRLEPVLPDLALPLAELFESSTR